MKKQNKGLAQIELTDQWETRDLFWPKSYPHQEAGTYKNRHTNNEKVKLVKL